MQAIHNVISDLSLTEKASLVAGDKLWYTQAVKSAALPPLMMTDGPSGLRKQADSPAGENTGLGKAVTAVSYPASALTACSFDRQLLFEVGKNLGIAAHANDVGVLLGPGVNIKRSPLAGRNFEYFSEDPYLTGELGTQYVKGVQSENVGVAVKHFAANNREDQRFTNSSEIDPRTLREIYLAAFERIVKQANPASIMCSYNKLNGVLNSQNKALLTTILREEWNFQGLVMSDWGAVADHVAAIKAGLDLEMPGRGAASTAEIEAAVKAGTLDEAILDRAVQRILNLVMTYLPANSSADFYDLNQQHEFVRRAAAESMVLLKNDEAVLPLTPKDKLLIVGDLAQKPSYQGGGSSHVSEYQMATPVMAARRANAHFEFQQGYALAQTEPDDGLETKALEAAKKVDKVIVFAGYPEVKESEGFDKTDIDLPANQNHLIAQLTAVSAQVIVVLQNGSVVTMPWLDKVQGVLETYLAGEGVGEATFDVLSGKVNPSGKLAETFPVQLADNPTYLGFNKNPQTEVYREGLFVGYRYYDTKQITPLFPFGFGLSYTSFEYHNLAVQVGDDHVTVSFTIKNTGLRAGKEVAQIYVANHTSAIEKPQQELKQFIKVTLDPGQQKAVSVDLDRRAFSWYNADTAAFQVDNGSYEIKVAASSIDPKLQKTIDLQWTPVQQPLVTGETYLSDFLLRSDSQELLQQSKLKQVVESLTADKTNVAMLTNMPLRALASMGAQKQRLQRLYKLANNE